MRSKPIWVMQLHYPHPRSINQLRSDASLITKKPNLVDAIYLTPKTFKYGKV